MNPPAPRSVEFVDSHTGGEPTRTILSGGPDLGSGPLAERAARFRREHARFRSAVVGEPRGAEGLVGALLCEPDDPACGTGVIFFNRAGVLGMCGHGTMGLLVTLAHLGRLGPGAHRIDTPAGAVTAELLGPHEVAVENVASFRHAKDVIVEVDGRAVRGDVAWGGNWFFLAEDPPVELALANVPRLTAFAWAIRRELARRGIAGAGGREIDHIELLGPSPRPEVDRRSFVLCPDGAYDRSPCGTGTSAKAACLFEDGKLEEGRPWRQESIVGSVFEASVRLRDGRLHPIVRGSAYVTARGVLVFDPEDPFADGLGA